MNGLSVWGKNGKEREKACSQATNVKILRGGSRRGARGGPGPLLFLDQTEGRRAEKNFLGRAGDRVPSLSKGLDDRAPTYLKV